MRSYCRIEIIVIAILALAGCSPRSSSDTGVLLASQSTTLEAPSENPAASPLVPILTITQAGDAPFGRLGQPTLDERGNIYVPDYQHLSVFAFTSDGSFVRSYGERGEAPGEFRIPVSVDVRDNMIYVYDNQLYRLTVFDATTGEVENTLDMQTDGWVPATVLGVTGDAVVTRASSSERPSPDGPPRASTAVLRQPLGGAAADPIWFVPGPEMFYMEVNGFPGRRVKPLTQHPQCDVAGERVFCAHSSIDIDVFSALGDSLGIIHIPVEPQEVTAEDRTRVLERMPARLRETMQVAEVHPTVSGLVAADDNRIWLRRSSSSESGTVYWVIDLPAEHISVERFDGVVRIGAVTNGRAVGVRSDDDGVQSVVVYETTG